MSSAFDPAFRKAAARHRVPAGLIKACAMAESGLDIRARRREAHLDDESRGLMQILVGTARDLGETDPEKLWDPDRNVDLGAKYLRQLYGRFGEIPTKGEGLHDERWKFAVAAYNAGRGHVNRALAAARRSLGMDGALDGSMSGPWQRWWFTSSYLYADERGRIITGRNAVTTWRHVARVWSYYWQIEQLGTFSGRPERGSRQWRWSGP